MGEFQKRIDRVGSHLIAKSTIELLIAEFITDYSFKGKTAVEQWFGDDSMKVNT